MLKVLSLITSLIILSLIYFDMVNPIVMAVICSVYVIDIIVNSLGVVLFSIFTLAHKGEFKDTIKERMLMLMEKDKSFYFRSSLVLILEAFILYMLVPLSIHVSVILGSAMVLQLVNIIFARKASNYDCK